MARRGPPRAGHRALLPGTVTVDATEDDDGRVLTTARSDSATGSAPTPERGIGPRDWAMAVAVSLAHLVLIRSGQGGAPEGPWVGVLVLVLAIGSGLALLWRRTRPRTAAVVVLGCFAGLSVAQGLVPPYAGWVLIWSLASSAWDRRDRAVLAGVVAGATALVLGVAELSRPGSGAVVLLLALTALVTLAAFLVRSERARVAAVGRRAATEERLRIARDLHDLVGHGLSAIAVQSSTARLALTAGDGAAASRAIEAVESSSRTALREMRQMLGVLTDEGASGEGGSGEGGPDGTEPGTRSRPAPGVADLPDLVERLRAGGVAVSLERSGEWEAASSAAQVAAYRVVQESLTNAVKHAPGALVAVRLRTMPTDSVGTVSVVTTGAAPTSAGPPRDRAGAARGLAGLEVRVEALGGTFASGPTEAGWLVEARIPLHPEARP